MLSNFLSPIPFTLFSSSIFLNFPFCFLYSIILSANAGPIPSIVSKSADVAVFILIFSLFSLLLLPDEVFILISSISSSSP